MNELKRISVIVPVYNAEGTLRRCVESILHQTYPNLELILVNDGSQDGSLAICEEYAAADNRVIVIDKENSGVSATRSIGIRQASGDYLQFVDSDDKVTPDAAALLSSSLERHNCQLAVGDFYRVSNDLAGQKATIKREGVLTLKEFAAEMSKAPANFYYGVLWNKLYRRDIIVENNITFDEDLNWCEDFLFNLEYMRHIDQIAIVRAPVYYYNDTKNSLVKKNATVENTVKVKIKIFEHYQQIFQNVGLYNGFLQRGKVARFFFAAATDGMNNPFSPYNVPVDELTGEPLVPVPQLPKQPTEEEQDAAVRRAKALKKQAAAEKRARKKAEESTEPKPLSKHKKPVTEEQLEKARKEVAAARRRLALAEQKEAALLAQLEQQAVL